MKAKLFIFLYAISASIEIHAQSGDYLHMIPREKMMTCGISDSATNELLNQLLKLPVDSITQNKASYFYDLSLCYYHLFFKTTHKIYSNKTIEYSNLALQEDSSHAGAYNNLLVLNYVEGDCMELKEVYDLYTKHVEKDLWDKKQLKKYKKRIGKCK